MMGILTALGRGFIRKDSATSHRTGENMNSPTEQRRRARGMVKEPGTATLSMDEIRELALRRPGTPVLSVYVRIDPHDPATTGAVPGLRISYQRTPVYGFCRLVPTFTECVTTSDSWSVKWR